MPAFGLFPVFMCTKSKVVSLSLQRARWRHSQFRKDK